MACAARGLVARAGVMLVTALDNTPAEAFGSESVVGVALSESQRAALLSDLSESFTHAAGGAAPVRTGPYENSLYYAASVGYSGLRNCNTWAAETLHHAGLPIGSRGVVLAGQLWRQVRKLGRAGAR